MVGTWLFVGGAIVLDGGAALVAGLVPERWLERGRAGMLGFASGVLLATTFLDLLPEAVARLGASRALAVVLGSVVAMLLLEWTIGHRGAERAGGRRLAAVLLGADGFHNAADGAAIAAAFLVSRRVGVATALAVIVHEVPEEIADYVLLRKAGLRRAPALVAMAGVQLTAALGAVLVLVGAGTWSAASGVALALAAGTFLHIAEVDLVPAVLAQQGSPRRRFVALASLALGVGLVVVEAAA